MSSYEADPAGLGVGKRYGALHLGGVAGVTDGSNGTFSVVAEVSIEELAANASIDIRIPEGYAKIEDVLFEVEEAFPALDTLDVFYNGVTVLSAPVAVDTLGIATGTVSVSVINGDVPLTIDASGITATATAGFVKVIVSLKRV